MLTPRFYVDATPTAAAATAATPAPMLSWQ